jgi:predicted nuclease of predicted toxin-antitoxin system
MKFLIDAQLPRRLAHQLSVAGYETTHTLDLPQGNRTTDQSLITSRSSNNASSLQKDSDFVESFLLKREPWRLLLVSTGNIGNDELLRVFQLNIDQSVESVTTFDFIELNRTSMICHL